MVNPQCRVPRQLLVEFNSQRRCRNRDTRWERKKLRYPRTPDKSVRFPWCGVEVSCQAYSPSFYPCYSIFSAFFHHSILYTIAIPIDVVFLANVRINILSCRNFEDKKNTIKKPGNEENSGSRLVVGSNRRNRVVVKGICI